VSFLFNKSILLCVVGWDGLDMLNEKMIMTGSNVVYRGKLKELDREDAQKRPGGIVLRMAWKV